MREGNCDIHECDLSMVSMRFMGQRRNTHRFFSWGNLQELYNLGE